MTVGATNVCKGPVGALLPYQKPFTDKSPKTKSQTAAEVLEKSRCGPLVDMFVTAWLLQKNG